MPVWKSVPGYDRYEVSDDGQVRRNGRILKPYVTSKGYLRINSSVQGRVRQLPIHRLVLLAFVGQPPKGMEARHYPDRDPANNRLENLSWASCSVNARDRKEHGTINSGERNGSSKLTWKQVLEIRERPFGTNAEMAEKFGVSDVTISLVKRGKRWRDKMSVALDETLLNSIRRKPRADALSDETLIAVNLFWRKGVPAPILAKAFHASKNTLYYRALTGGADSYPNSPYANQAKEINEKIDHLGAAEAWGRYVTDDMVNAVNQAMREAA